MKRWCSVCKSAGYHMSGCPEDLGPPDLPEADEDERGGEYEDEDHTVIDCWQHLDGVWAAREKRHG